MPAASYLLRHALAVVVLLASGLLLAAPVAAPVAAAEPARTGAAQIGLGAWSPMAALPNQGAEATSAPAAVSWGPGRLDLFVRGRSGELFQNYRENGNWSSWRVPDAFRGVSLRSAPSCTSWGVGRISCVALIDGDRQVWHFFYDGRAWAREPLGGDAWSAPVIVSPRNDQLAVFVVGGGARLFGRGWVPGRWSDWIDLGGELRAAPACAVWSGDSTIQCFVANTQGSLSRQEIVIQNERVSGLGYVPVAMNDQSGNVVTLGSAPTAVALGPGRIGLFVLNRNLNLFQTTWARQDFLVWQRANENIALTTPPSCAVLGAGLASCFARGADNPFLGAFGDIIQASANVR
ncbi:MAG: hypothetical protein AB4911_02030 [Oscillochloridaceae bacterium umkhey_bin13]